MKFLLYCGFQKFGTCSFFIFSFRYFGNFFSKAVPNTFITCFFLFWSTTSCPVSDGCITSDSYLWTAVNTVPIQTSPTSYFFSRCSIIRSPTLLASRFSLCLFIYCQFTVIWSSSNSPNVRKEEESHLSLSPSPHPVPQTYCPWHWNHALWPWRAGVVNLVHSRCPQLCQHKQRSTASRN